MTAELSRTIWQIAAGTADRDYTNLFLRHDIALIGPGWPGEWSADRSDEEFEGNFVRLFASELRIGDTLLLRKGRSIIRAVGLVESDYEFFEQFDDVNGWDLQHGRRVRWHELSKPHDFGKPVFGNSPSRISRVWSNEVVEYSNRLFASYFADLQARSLNSLLPKLEDIDSPPKELQEIVNKARGHSYWDKEKFGVLPSEAELVAHYVVPLLRALGWSIELIAVEWDKIDVCVFSKFPRTVKHCHLLIEAKRLGTGFEYASQQAFEYASRLDIQCDVVVTDGIRYRMYEAIKDSNPIEYEQVAYANLSNLKKPSLELFDRMRKP